MKNLLSKPGFEGIFALSIAAIIGLPPLVLAQDKKESIVKKRVEIRIKDGDTVINGKNIKNLTGKEREEALSHWNVDTKEFNIGDRGRKKRHIVIKRKDGNGKDVIIERNLENGGPEFFAFDEFKNDSLGKDIHVRINKLREDFPMEFRYQMGAPGVHAFVRPFDGFDKRNTQSFNYTQVDDEGISTHISYRAGDVPVEKLKEIASVEKAELDLNNLVVVPEFSTGKTTLTFTLTAKSNAEVIFKDSRGKVLWTDKAGNGSFSKSFSLPVNGVYYLQVNQGSNVAVKRIVKED